MKKISPTLLALTLGILLSHVPSAWGDFKFWVGNSPESPNFLWPISSPQELIAIDSTEAQFEIHPLNQSANNTFDPVYLLVAMPGAASNAAPDITQVNGGGVVDIDPTFEGNVNSTSTRAYDVAGLSGSPSQQWSNFIGAYTDLVGGTLPDHFAVFLYDLTTALAPYHGAQSTVDFGGSGLSQGTFAFGYAAYDDGSISDTPFTHGGFVTTGGGGGGGGGGQIPEPSTVVLLGSGLLGVALYGRRRFKK